MTIPDSNNKNLLEWAQYYRKIGWSIFPVGRDKRPLIEWKSYQLTRPTDKQIRHWWEQWPEANVGIVTGAISGLVVIDIEKGGDTKQLPPTIIAKTGGNGRHFFYKHPGRAVHNAVRIRELTDIRGDGGFVVAPPSLNKSGGHYEWIVSPDDADLTELPEWVLQGPAIRAGKKDWPKIAQGVPEGQRNETAASYIGKLLHDLSPELWGSAGWDAVREWNKKNTPPMEEKELRCVFESIASREREQRREIKLLVAKDKTRGYHEVARLMIGQQYVKTIGERKREIYVYRDGVYVLGENILRSKIQEILEEHATTHAKNEVIERIKDLTLTERTEFDPDKNLINLNNGVLDIETGKLHEHGPQYLFFSKIPVDYVPSVDCPRINKFLSEILPEADIPIIQEWFGYPLYRKYFIKKALILVGERDTGKTTLLRLFAAMIGKKNIAGVSLQRLSSDKFAAAHLYAKHVNLYDDLSLKDISDNGAFKIATGSGAITGEYKFGNQFQFENYAKLTFACNKIPSVKDVSDEAYFSRWIVVKFTREIENPDKFLIEKITTPTELSGLLNSALTGLRRLLQNGAFSYAKEPSDIKDEMLRSTSPIANFVADCLMQALGEWISKDNMYARFAEYAHQRGFPIGTKEKFGRRLPQYADYISEGKPVGGDGKQVTAWMNVALKAEQTMTASSPDTSDSRDIRVLPGIPM